MQEKHINLICDRAIIEFSRGDKDALSVIYDCMARMIFSVAYAITGNYQDAENVLQDTIIEITKYAHTYRGGSNAKAWILAMARHCSIDIVRKRKPVVSIEDSATTVSYTHLDVYKRQEYPIHGDKKTHAVRGVSLEIGRGCSMAITGPSGCGKTTLLNMIGLVAAPTAGDLYIEGGDAGLLSEKKKAAYRNSFYGYIVQDFALVEDYTVRENVEIPLLYSSRRYGARERKERAVSYTHLDVYKRQIFRRAGSPALLPPTLSAAPSRSWLHFSCRDIGRAGRSWYDHSMALCLQGYPKRTAAFRLLCFSDDRGHLLLVYIHGPGNQLGPGH